MEIEINRPRAGDFIEERQELLERLKGRDGRALKRVRETVEGATAIIAVRALLGDRAPDETLDRLAAPLWHWLFANRRGLLQANGEGFYDHEELILPE